MWTLTLFLISFQGSWHFTEVTESANVVFNHQYSGARDNVYIAAGVAAEDYDDDGWIDLYVVGGNQGSSALFRNLGNGRFQDVAAQAGVALPGRMGAGPTFADIDGDGHLDLFVGGIGTSPVLFRNRGDGSFEDITKAAGLEMTGDTFSAAFADTDRDGDLDLFVTHWQSGRANFFWRNNGDSTFTNVTDQLGFANQFKPDLSFTPNFADLNGDRWPDLLVASDLGHSQIFMNDGSGAFVETTQAVITDENGMGAAVADYDNDGDLDWFVSSIGVANPKRGTTGNRLYRNRGDGSFEDVTEASGVREGYWGWASSFADFNNDGHLDLFHVNGFLGPFAPGYDVNPAVFFANQGDGSFTEMAGSLGLDAPDQGRGLACFDYDRDGDLDIYVANNGGPGRLYRNDGGNSSNYLNIELNGTAPNTRAVGARVMVNQAGMTQTREIKSGNNFVSQDPYAAHFGLGAASQTDVRVVWPDGQIQVFNGVPVNQRLELTQPATPTPSCATTTRWLTHVTSDGGGFETRISLANFGQTDALVDLQAYEVSGLPLMTASLELAAGAHGEFTRDELFEGLPVSHLAIYAAENVSVTAGYRLAQGETAIAHVHMDKQDGTSFYVYPGNWDIVYDGLALINLGETPARIEAALVAADGTLSASVLLDAGLAPKAKLLKSLATVFDRAEGRMIRITTNQPSRAIFLRGTHGDIEPGLLYQVQQVPQPGDP